MKISQKQASLLAKEVFKKLMESNVNEVPESLQQKIFDFKEKRATLMEACNKADAELRKHDALLDKMLPNNIRGAYATNSAETIIASVKKANTPAIDEIENRIILSAMFSTEDLNAFIDRMVADFLPKKSKKV